MNRAAKNIQVSVWIHVLISLEYTPRSRINVLYSNTMFHSLRNGQTVFQSGSIISHSHQQWVRVQIPVCLCQYLLLSIFLMWVWSDSSLWFWFAFPWWLKMLNIISCIYWPFVYVLWWNVYSNPLPTFQLDCLSIVELSFFCF